MPHQDLFHRVCSFDSPITLRVTCSSKEPLEDSLSWGSHCLYACGFRIYFTPLPGFFSPFPHGTGSLSVAQEYLVLGDGPPKFPQGSSYPVVLGCRSQQAVPAFAYAALTLYGSPVRRVLPLAVRFVCLPKGLPSPPDRSHDPQWTTPAGLASIRFRLFPFRSPLLGESLIAFCSSGY